MDKLNGYVLAGKALAAQPAGLHSGTQSNMMEAKLNMFWHTGVSTGVGLVQFAVAEAANDAIIHIGEHPLNGHALKVKAAPELRIGKQAVIKLQLAADGTYSGRAEEDKPGLALRFPVRITGLPLGADEITLRDHFQSFGNIASVSMCRKDAPSTKSEEDDLAFDSTLLMSLAPKQPGRFLPVSKVCSHPLTMHYLTRNMFHYNNQRMGCSRKRG